MVPCYFYDLYRANEVIIAMIEHGYRKVVSFHFERTYAFPIDFEFYKDYKPYLLQVQETLNGDSSFIRVFHYNQYHLLELNFLIYFTTLI